MPVDTRRPKAVVVMRVVNVAIAFLALFSERPLVIHLVKQFVVNAAPVCSVRNLKSFLNFVYLTTIGSYPCYRALPDPADSLHRWCSRRIVEPDQSLTTVCITLLHSNKPAQ